MNDVLQKTNQDPLAALKDLAQHLRNSTAAILKYVKGKWSVGDEEFNGVELIARPDWLMNGWHRLWDGQVTDRIVGYVGDGFDPPPRELLGDHDKDEWAIYCKGRDPWILQYTLPLYHPVSGRQFIWSTNTRGGQDAIGSLLTAYIERVELAPEDGTVLPRVALNSGGYTSKEGHFVATPEPDILGWVRPPSTPRPVLPPPPPLTAALPSPESAPVIEDSSPKVSYPANSPFNDEIPFALAFFIVVAWLVTGGGSTLIA
jgi:hypothetical protein